MLDLDKPLEELVPMKYYAFPSSYNRQQKHEKLKMLLDSDQYIYSLKTDGNWARTIWEDGEITIQSRGISNKTGNHGEFRDKVFFAEDIRNAFTDTTLLLGEVYIENGHDRDVGAILRCSIDKAIARQTKGKELKYRIFDCWYYNGVDLRRANIMERIKYITMAEKAINNAFVSSVKYYPAKSENFFEKIERIFNNGGEGVVLYNKNSTPCEGRTPAWQTLKIKQEIDFDVDCFICGTEPPVRLYTGKEVDTWQYWQSDRTNEKFLGTYFSDYVNGGTISPVTKNWFYDLPGAIKCGVWGDNHEIVELCKCSGLTDEMREGLRDNYDDWHMKPIKIAGMMLSKTVTKKGEEQYSIRHPKLRSFRDLDIDIEDCTLSKILESK